jgi:hypothetical protein
MRKGLTDALIRVYPKPCPLRRAVLPYYFAGRPLLVLSLP